MRSAAGLAGAFTALVLSRPAVAAVLPENALGELATMRAKVTDGLEWISTGIEVTGVGIIVIGAILATLVYLRAGLRGAGWGKAFRGYRANLGRGILLGLELLVAADIIGTVAVAPSFQTLGVLAMIVLIRTFLSFSLEVEIEGQWPWRRSAMEREGGKGERL